MFLKSLRVAIILSFVLLMGQQSCQTSPSTSSGLGNDVTGSAVRGGAVPGDRGPGGSVTCGSPQNDFQCMMCNCFLEAGNQNHQGMVAVNKVVMTRVRMSSYPNSVCGVIYQRSQFSWTNSSRTRNRTVSGENYNRCYNSVREAYNFQGHFASHYHADYVAPGWRRGCRGRFVIGDHIFYQSCGGQQRAPEGSNTSPSVAYLLEETEDGSNGLQCSL